MSSSTESISNGEEKKGNSKNNSKDEMPKVTSTMETNSKGARPKTSSTPEKSKKETEENEQFLNVLIMNASGDKKQTDQNVPARRKDMIKDVIKEHNPDLVLFQEWEEKLWPDDTVQTGFKLLKNKNTCTTILYNVKKLTLEDESRIPEFLKNPQPPTGTDPSKSPKHSEFDPFPRMCLKRFKPTDKPDMEFICISWHGRHACLSKEEKITEFTNLMSFLNEINAKIQLPILIGGDFNVEMELIKKKVQESFKLYEYKASERRKEKGVIDYFITSTRLHLSDITPVNLKELSKGLNLEELSNVLDHDPIRAKLKFAAPLSDTASAQDQVTDTMKNMAI